MTRIPTLRRTMPTLNGRTLPDGPKQPEAWYRTPQHVAWSRAVKERAGYQCERCGERALYADHITEIKDGGTWELSNGQALCASCHTSKTMAERARRAYRSP